MKLFIMNVHAVWLMLLVTLALFTSPVFADLQVIRPGSTVFLGEEGLDITASGITDGGQIGWWAPGSMRASEPTELVMVSSPSSFYVSPSTFSGKEGLWYTWPDGNVVFQVKSPQVSIRVYDESSDFDATGRWIPRGDSAGFRISSNVYEANARGGPDGQVDIILISPEGAKYSSVSGPSGSFSLERIPLTSSLTSTGPVWNTGGAGTGTWKVQAEISMNQIKNNLPDIGVGVSAPVEVLIQNVNPLIKPPTRTQAATSLPTVQEPTTLQTPMPPPVSTPVTPSKPAITPSPIPTFLQTPEQTTPTPAPVMTPDQTTSPKIPEVTATPEVPDSPTPVPTKSPLGIFPVLGAMMVLLFIRRF